MPTVTEEVVEGLAFCPDPRCPGYEQVPAAVKVTHVGWSYIELGGDLPGIERGARYEAFPLADGEHPPACPECGTQMEATTQERPVYARISGQDPLRLLSLDQNTISRAMQQGQNDQALEMERLRTQLAEMRAEMMGMVLAARTGADATPASAPDAAPAGGPEEGPGDDVTTPRRPPPGRSTTPHRPRGRGT